MIAIKNWFLEKNDLTFLKGQELTVVRESVKALLISCIREGKLTVETQVWIPKSVIINAWEEEKKPTKDTSNFGYHDYLVKVYRTAYKNGDIKNYTFYSGNNRYNGDDFIHQETTKTLVKLLAEKNIPFMNRTEWNNREEH